VSAKTKNLIPFRYKVIAVVVVVLGATFYGSVRDETDYSDRDKYRVVAWHVAWHQFGNRERPLMLFVYDLGSTKREDSSHQSPFSDTGMAKQGYVITMYAQVEDQVEDRVVNLACAAYVDGRPVKPDITGEGGKFIRCTAVVHW
jgi:hypothetical protein